MEFRKLASEIAKIEGKKRQVSVGNVRDVLKITLHLLGKEILDNNGVCGPLVDQLKIYGKKKLK
jgi:hypothetical protein